MRFETYKNFQGKLSFLSWEGEVPVEIREKVKSNEGIMAYLDGKSILSFNHKDGDLILENVVDSGGLNYKQGAVNLVAEILEVKS